MSVLAILTATNGLFPVAGPALAYAGPEMGWNTMHPACLTGLGASGNGIALIESLGKDYERALEHLGVALGICPDGCVVVDCSRSSAKLMDDERAVLFLYKLCRAADRRGISLCAHSHGFPEGPGLQESMMFWLGSHGFVALTDDPSGLEMIRQPGRACSVGFEREAPFLIAFERAITPLQFVVSEGSRVHLATPDAMLAYETIGELADGYWRDRGDASLGWRAYVSTIEAGRRYLSSMDGRMVSAV